MSTPHRTQELFQLLVYKPARGIARHTGRVIPQSARPHTELVFVCMCCSSLAPTLDTDVPDHLVPELLLTLAQCRASQLNHFTMHRYYFVLLLFDMAAVVASVRTSRPQSVTGRTLGVLLLT